MVDKLIEQKLRTAVLRGSELLNDKGLYDWDIKINKSRSSLAQTNHFEKTIYYSRYFLIAANKEQLDGITLHEVAHALLGPGKGHGVEFVKLCARLGLETLYACRRANIQIGIYKAECKCCGYSGSCNDKKDKYCDFCYEKGIISKFVLSKNEINLETL